VLHDASAGELVDWSKPDGKTLRLAMEIGLPSFAGAMTQRFDLGAVDPRGLGRSTPIRCAEPPKPAGVTYFPPATGPPSANSSTATARRPRTVCAAMGHSPHTWI
jgi:hypothetical protein